MNVSFKNPDTNSYILWFLLCFFKFESKDIIFLKELFDWFGKNELGRYWLQDGDYWGLCCGKITAAVQILQGWVWLGISSYNRRRVSDQNNIHWEQDDQGSDLGYCRPRKVVYMFFFFFECNLYYWKNTIEFLHMLLLFVTFLDCLRFRSCVQEIVTILDCLRLRSCVQEIVFWFETICKTFWQ